MAIKKGNTSIGFVIDEISAKKLKEKAKADHRSLSSFIKLIVLDFLKEEEKRAPIG